jgi:hypothetical protein
MKAAELQKRARRRLTQLRRRTNDARFQRAMSRYVRDGLLIANREYPGDDRPVSVEDVLWAGDLEPRLLELLPALIIERPAMFTGLEELPVDLSEVVKALRQNRLPPDFRQIPGRDVFRWLGRFGRVRGEGKGPSRLKSFRFTPADQRLIDDLARELELTETDVIRRALRTLHARGRRG